MIRFATEFPVASSNSSDFLDSIRGWILDSPHTDFTSQHLAQLDDHVEWQTEESGETVEALRFVSRPEESAAVRYSKRGRKFGWVTTIVFAGGSSGSWVGLRIACESHHPAARLPPVKKPIAVRVLLERLHGGRDGDLRVRPEPLRLENVDIDIAARCMTGRAGCRLPIVYVSADFQGGHLVDPSSMADRLSGMAHVLVEPNRPFSIRLMREVNSQNVYGGTIGLYWPAGTGRRCFFLGPEFDSPADIEMAVFDEVREALVNRRPKAGCTWAAVQQSISRRAFEKLKDKGSTEVDRYVQEFDKELEAKEEALRDAEAEIARLQSEMRRYEAQNPMGAGLVLKTSSEQDLYEDEMRQVVLDALERVANRVSPKSRRKDILTSLLEANPSSEIAKENRDRLKALLRGFRSLDSKTRRGLYEMGFDISEEGKHYKLVFQGDERYVFTLPKSGSDHRGGLNAATDIARKLF